MPTIFPCSSHTVPIIPLTYAKDELLVKTTLLAVPPRIVWALAWTATSSLHHCRLAAAAAWCCQWHQTDRRSLLATPSLNQLATSCCTGPQTPPLAGLQLQAGLRSACQDAGCRQHCGILAVDFFVQCACDLASQDWPDGPKHAIHGSNIAQRSSCRSVVLGNTNFTLVLPSHPYRSFRRRQLLTRSNFEGTTQGTMASRGMMAGAQDIWDRETDAAGCPSRAEARAASGCSLRPLPLQRTILWASLSCLSG